MVRPLPSISGKDLRPKYFLKPATIHDLIDGSGILDSKPRVMRLANTTAKPELSTKDWLKYATERPGHTNFAVIRQQIDVLRCPTRR
jgi:hypothetical protein